MTTPRAADDLVELAAVIRAHGLGGMVVLKLFNPDSELIYDLEQVTLRSGSGAIRSLRIVDAREHSGNVLCSFEGVTGRDAAEALRGSVLCVTRAELPEPEEGEHYFLDLVGLTVQDEKGAAMGSVEDVIEYPSVICLKVVSDDGILELPHTDRYVASVDLEKRIVYAAHVDELDILRTQKGKR